MEKQDDGEMDTLSKNQRHSGFQKSKEGCLLSKTTLI
jgi:hypothetical protein